MEDYEKVRESIDRAIEAVKGGRAPQERCVFCGGAIEVTADPPGGPYTQYAFKCPCGKSSGFLKGL